MGSVGAYSAGKVIMIAPTMGGVRRTRTARLTTIPLVYDAAFDRGVTPVWKVNSIGLTWKRVNACRQDWFEAKQLTDIIPLPEILNSSLLPSWGIRICYIDLDDGSACW